MILGSNLAAVGVDYDARECKPSPESTPAAPVLRIPKETGDDSRFPTCCVADFQSADGSNSEVLEEWKLAMWQSVRNVERLAGWKSATRPADAGEVCAVGAVTKHAI